MAAVNGRSAVASPAARPFYWPFYESVAMVIGLGSLALICLGWLPLALLLRWLLPARRGRDLGRRAVAAGCRFYVHILTLTCACRFDLGALDEIERETPLIIAANHPSLLDAVLILSRRPEAVCIMKASLMDNLLFGAAARLAHYIRNNAPLEMVLLARQELRQGEQLLIFPEGTRTTRWPLSPCLPSLGLIAQRADTPVQTLLIEFSTPYLGKDWPLFRRPVLPLRGRVRLGRRFPPPSDVAAFTAELEAYFRSELRVAAAPACPPLA
jgi:1-acyl-sn-glycerol-3-phosphate acyltransferase